MTEQEREELIEKMGKAFVNTLMFDDGIRAALAVAEPVIREQCAEAAEKSLGTWGAANALYIAAAIREGGKDG